MTDEAGAGNKKEDAKSARDFGELEQYPKLIAGAVPNEKCLPCLLCEPVCPTGAIQVTFNKNREDFGPLRKGIAGKISVDEEKCNLCGRCARFCKAFLLVDRLEREENPKDLAPYEQLLVDDELCDYCGLCAPICPEEAISVEGVPIEAAMEFKGEIKVDRDLCIGCGRCALVCPYEAIDVKRPFEGELCLIEKNMAKCDPSGCQACFNVCPAKCWYVDEREKAAPVKEQCILCGACAKACPALAIDVKRSGVHHTEIRDLPWASEWKDAISSIVSGEKKRPDTSMAVLPPDVRRLPPPKIEMLARDPELERLVDEAISPLFPVLKRPKVRYLIEREPASKASARIVERLKKEIVQKGASVENGKR
jgi:4Fe-4S ferredoxin